MNTKLKLYFGLQEEYSVKILKSRAFRSNTEGCAFLAILFPQLVLF